MPFYPNDLSTTKRKRPTTYYHRKTFPPAIPAATACVEYSSSCITTTRKRTSIAPLIRFSAADKCPSFRSSTCSSNSSSTISLTTIDLQPPATPPPAYHVSMLTTKYENNVVPDHLGLDEDDDDIPLADVKHWLLQGRNPIHESHA
ncbi:predicted protein [Lichtheimia corymbifera JMRC:FSU:9682]|uniref:Uncharacterized protein n=1 Tax=Lichtheimia corymbifera JMRC:FSU:9682 TaxID=1263082 RepID=A0A068RWT3_9FUNG|nr:predicted protein [Lichtheimia corymbifera JMRC:FSU:9682]